MRGSLSMLSHATAERRRLRALVASGQATPEQRTKLDRMTEQLLEGLLEEVIQLTRELNQVAADARRRRFLG